MITVSDTFRGEPVTATRHDDGQPRGRHALLMLSAKLAQRGERVSFWTRCGISATLGLALIGSALGLASSASAAEVHMEGTKLVYTGAPGERNQPYIQPDVQRTGQEEVRISDSLGTNITAGGGCFPWVITFSGSETGAYCPTPASISLTYGDSADFTGSTFGAPTYIDAGSGNDNVSGPTGYPTTILGRSGDDDLTGDSGRDFVDGGAGNDTISSYSLKQHGDRKSGGPGNDRITGAGTVSGGSGNDQITVLAYLRGPKNPPTDVGGARVDGGSGNDRIAGGNRKDLISGGKGRDRISGGKGDDRISVADGKRDRVDCGPGRDRVRADRLDLLRRCEKIIK